MEIVHPIRHKLSMTRERVIACLIASWIIGLFVKVTIITGTTKVIKGQCVLGWYPSDATKRAGGLFNAMFEFFLPLVIIAFCYIEMARAVRKVHMRAVGANPWSNSQMSRARKNILKILTVVTVFFIVTTAPKQVR